GARVILPIAVDGAVAGVLWFAYAEWRALGDDDHVLAGALAAQLASSLERARSYARETTARGRATFLSDASAVLGGSLDFEITLRSVARLAVPVIADWCVVELAPDIASGAEPVIVHADPARIELAREYRRRFPPDPRPGAGETIWAARIPPGRIAARPAEERAYLERLGLASFVVVPMTSRGRVLGTLALVSGEARRPFGEDDVRMTEELGRRAGVAIDNALLYRDSLAADRRKDEFLAILGHELRNPLAPILTALELIEMRGSIGSRERAIMGRNLRHMMRLVDDLLDVSRIARGKVDLDKQPVALGQLLDQAIEQARSQFEHKRIELSYAAPPTATVFGDPVRLVQVFGNVLANAARYTQVGGHVGVRASVEAGRVRVRIRDDGAGIAPELLPRVFELFEQGQRGVSHGGLGIGLAICRSLLALHGGKISAHSDGVGRGSEFVIELPVWTGPERIASGTPPLAIAAATRGLRDVLVVDDNTDAAEMLADALTRHGYRVAISHDGARALAHVSTEHPDIVLLDIGLPDMDGYEVARRIRALQLDKLPHVVAVSGYGQTADRERSLASGFDAHLVKPVDLRQLLGLLDAAR
ncbi:MAG TPA: ATP-binding protein, partial [Kofleriaceae bacterium]|nr:ATP-binding protein [Kofleriaceae bacterium]